MLSGWLALERRQKESEHDCLQKSYQHEYFQRLKADPQRYALRLAKKRERYKQAKLAIEKSQSDK